MFAQELLIDVQDAHVTLRHEKLCHQVLHHIDFQLFAGEHCAIVGTNGSGKSTFLRLLRGEVWADAVKDSCAPQPIQWYVQGVAEKSPIMGRRMTALVSAAKQEAYVRHEWRLTGEDILLTAFSDGQLLHFIPDAVQKNAVLDMAKHIKAVHLLQQEACALSQGQLRLLLLGRALLQKPRVLLLDECMDGLDVVTRRHFITLLQECGCTVVFTDHRPHGIPSWVQHRYTLQQGRLSIEEPLVPTRQGVTTAKDTTNTCLNNSVVQSKSNETGPVFIHIAQGTVYLERKALLHDISWTWRQGEHWMLHGENGSGKSTFLRLLAGQEYVAWGGTLQRFCQNQGTNDFVPVQDLAGIQAYTALLSDREQQCYGYDVTGVELVLSGLEWVQGVYREYSEEEYARAEQLLADFQLLALTDRRIRSLSTGQLRRLLLARLCMARPQLLLLDEPFSGLDKQSYNAMRQMVEMQCERKDNPAHILLVSHYEEDRLACINRDALLKEGVLSEIAL